MGQGSNSHLCVWGRRDSQQVCMMEVWANWKVMGRLTKKKKQVTAKKPEEDCAINDGASHTCTDTHRANAHLGHLSGLLQEAFHLLLSIRNVHCRSADDRKTESLLQKRDAKLKNSHNNITSKLENTHYFCVASAPPLGTRSGNGQNKRNREKRLQYLGQKALRALEKEFRI